MQGDNSSIVAHELNKGIRKLKNKLAARQLAETYQPDELDPLESETDSPEGGLASDRTIPSEISLLWPPEYAAPETETWLDENSIRDLGLEEMISGIVRRSSGRECRPAVTKILLDLCDKPEVLHYRQNVIEDLLRYPGLVEGFEKLLPKLTNLDQYGQANEQKITLYRVTWWLGELELYLECIKTLGEIFEKVDGNLCSEGLRWLRDLTTTIQQDQTFHHLERELPGLLARMRGIASVTIGVNLDDKLQPIEATLISVNEERFSEAPLLRMLLRKTNRQEGVMPIHSVPKPTADPATPIRPGAVQTNPLMVPLFRDLSQVLERVSEPIAHSLKRYIQLNRRFLARLEPELAFYTGAVRMIKSFMESGLPMCRPELVPKEERICEVEDSYNANLALHLLDREGQRNLQQIVVTNDVAIGPEGRIIILTGPNRGGKTTYAQAIGLTQVLAQAGLYVPGTRARISPVDGVYTHYPLEEKLDKGTGRFGDEARRLHEIFTRATRYSLILLNESLSGTAGGESLYLARDVVRIMRMMGTRAIFATHLHELGASVDRLNTDSSGDSKIVSMVASLAGEEAAADQGPETPIKRSYKVVFGPPMGRSYAREIAVRYGISFEQLRELLDQRGVEIGERQVRND